MTDMPKKAFILAAGKGTRLRPYTDHVPKPMVEVGGLPIIDRALDHLIEGGVEDVWINLHYKADILRSHLDQRQTPRLHYAFEEELLDTGGGVKNCLKQIGQDPFYVINGDALWFNGRIPSLAHLANNFDQTIMDIILLLQPLKQMTLTKGVGDYDLLEERPKREVNIKGQYMFTGIRLVHPRLFDHSPDGAFSFLELMDKAEKNARLGALIHEGDWHHISTPQDLEAVNDALNKAKSA